MDKQSGGQRLLSPSLRSGGAMMNRGEKIRVLYIITQLDLGGAQKNVLELAAALDKNRYQVTLISSEGLLASAALNLAGVTVKFLRSLTRPVNPLRDIPALIILARFIKRHQIDIVHTHSSKAGILGRWAARAAGAPVILHTIHGWGFHEWQLSALRTFFVSLERWTARITQRLIAVAQSDIHTGLACGIGTADKYVLIRHGITRSEFADGRMEGRNKKKEFNIREDAPVVGMAACFKPQKAPRVFLQAAALVKKSCPRARFVLAGDGALRGRLEKLREQLGLREEVIFAGWQRDMPRMMAMWDVFALTSLWEGLPVVFLEAMATGLPVVATPAGGAREVIKEGVNGFLVPFNDAPAMAEKIVLLLQDRQLARRMGEAGKRMLAAAYEKEYMVGEIDRLYTALLHK